MAGLTAGAPPRPDDDDTARFQTITQWPQLIVRGGDQVLVVGGDGVEHEHLPRIPADQRSWMWRTVLRYVDGQLLVCWDIGDDRAGYWSGEPDDVFVTPTTPSRPAARARSRCPAGAAPRRGRPLHVGDRTAQELARIAGDGATFWV